MIGRLSRLAFSFLLAGTLLSACSSGPAVDPQITTALSARNVDPATYSKVYSGRVLSFDDILDLVQKDVPPHIIVGYLQSTEKAYDFTPSQLRTLRNAGAAPQITNYLEESEGFYAHNPPSQAERHAQQQASSYYNNDYEQENSSFGYNEPIVDGFYDSGYEESLYSPFSLQ